MARNRDMFTMTFNIAKSTADFIYLFISAPRGMSRQPIESRRG